MHFVIPADQRREGSSGSTSMEFEDVMEQIRQDAEAKLAPFLKAEGMDCGDILYSWTTIGFMWVLI